MSRVFWPLFAVNVVFVVLVFAALPFGPDLVFLAAAVAQLGMLAVLGRVCFRLAREWDEPLSPLPPSHPVWRGHPHS